MRRPDLGQTPDTTLVTTHLGNIRSSPLLTSQQKTKQLPLCWWWWLCLPGSGVPSHPSLAWPLWHCLLWRGWGRGGCSEQTRDTQARSSNFYCVLMAERLATTAETSIKTGGLEAPHRCEVWWELTGWHFAYNGEGSFSFIANKSSYF